MTPQQTLESCVAKMHGRPTIRLGSKDDPRGKTRFVREWQVLMQREMRAAIKSDGIFGPDTLAATVAFQRKAGLPADGVVGAKTWTSAAVAPCYATRSRDDAGGEQRCGALQQVQGAAAAADVASGPSRSRCR